MYIFGNFCYLGHCCKLKTAEYYFLEELTIRIHIHCLFFCLFFLQPLLLCW